jgi:hypothetical protein
MAQVGLQRHRKKKRPGKVTKTNNSVNSALIMVLRKIVVKIAYTPIRSITILCNIKTTLKKHNIK